MIVDSEEAQGAAVLAAASRSVRVHFESRNVLGEQNIETGLVHVPHGHTPKAGWPVASFGHMTTGGSDRSAPSLATADHPELRRMTQGDAFVERLLERGIAVVRPDYEGIGSVGPHPYLIGPSLARSAIDLVQAARAEYALSSQWLSTGHSEGAMAALWAASIAEHDPGAEGLKLVGVCAFTPVTRMERTIGFSLRLPVVLPGFAVLSPLIALMLSGAATVDPDLTRLLNRNGLSEPARAIWGHLSERSLNELCASDSWGAIAPSKILGTDGAEVKDRLFASFRQNEVARLTFPQQLPMRIEASRFDEVAPYWLTGEAMHAWRSGGAAIDTRWWSTSHSPILRADRAPAGAADWCARLVT